MTSDVLVPSWALDGDLDLVRSRVGHVLVTSDAVFVVPGRWIGFYLRCKPR